MYKRSAGLLLLSAYSFQISAHTDKLYLDKIEVVSPTPLATLGVPINEVPSNVQVGTSNEVKQQQSSTLADFINDNLGSVNISNGTGNPYQPDVEYRGFTASPQLGQPAGLSVYFDGVRVNEPLGDIVNWDLIPMNSIASINLMPGSNPLFGLNTLGGALAVTTKNGADYSGISASLAGGSYGGRQFQLEVGGVDKAHNVDYFVSSNFYSANGWRESTNTDVNQIFSKVRWHDDFSTLDLSVSLAKNKLNQGQTLPESLMNNPKQAYTGPDQVKNQMAFINLKGSTYFSDTKLLEGNVYYRRSNAQSVNSNAAFDNGSNGWTGNNVDATNAYSRTYQTGYGAAGQFSFLDDLLGHKNQFTGGASVDISDVTFNQNNQTATLIGNQTVNSIDPLGNGGFDGGGNPLPTDGNQKQVNFKARNYNYGLFATNNFAVNDKINVTASARYNVAQVRLSGVDNNFYDPSTGGPGGTSSLAGSHTYSRMNPSIGFTYNPSHSLGFYGGYNEGMRAPNALELECSDPTRPCTLPVGFAADPNLKMVVAKTWEGGVRGSFGTNLHWNAGAFVTNINNDIEMQVLNSSRGYFSNVGTTRRQGIELGLNGKFDALMLSAKYSFVDATYQSSFQMRTNSSIAPGGVETINKGDELPGIARQTIKLRAAYDITPKWNVGSNVILMSGQWARGDEFNQDPAGKIPGYAFVNLDTRYNFNQNWQVFGKITNVFDKQYTTFGILNSSIYGNGNPELFVTPSVPRAIWVGINYNFGGSRKDTGVDKD